MNRIKLVQSRINGIEGKLRMIKLNFAKGPNNNRTKTKNVPLSY